MLTTEPEKIGKYCIHSVLGRGAMGTVYKGYDNEIDRYVAIKVLHPHLLTDEMGAELEQRFEHEVKAAAKCLHQNIVTIFDCGNWSDSPYMVMEYIKGIDLRVILKSRQTINMEHAIGMICNVLSALHAAHEMGIVHRDIKPANIMLLENGVVKVADFGVAKIDNSELTQIGDVIGTPSYMSPEAKAGSYVDKRSDLYSTALVLFELLTLKRLKPSQTDSQNLSETLDQLDIPRLQKDNLITVFSKALDHNPDHRYQTALQQSKAFSKVLDESIDYYQQADALAETIIHIKRTIKPNIGTVHSEQLTSSSLSQIKSDDLSIVEKSLTKYLGPVAKVLVKKQAKRNPTMDQLLDSLSSHIPSAKEREGFMQSLESSNIFKKDDSIVESKVHNHSLPQSVLQKNQSLSLSNEEINNLAKDLIIYLGPIAKHIIKLELKKAATQQELYTLLAEKIPNVKQRQQFLNTRSNET